MPSHMQHLQTFEQTSWRGRAEYVRRSCTAWEVDHLQVWLPVTTVWIHRTWLQGFQQSVKLWVESVQLREGQERRAYHWLVLPHSSQETLHHRWLGIHGPTIVSTTEVPLGSVDHVCCKPAQPYCLLCLPNRAETRLIRRVLLDKPSGRVEQPSLARPQAQSIR